jgi:hypothetical protein
MHRPSFHDHRFTDVGAAVAVLSPGRASRAPTSVTVTWKVTLPAVASSFVNE